MSEGSPQTFVRPVWVPGVYRDESGNLIEYGERWDAEPPQDAYSRTSNLERFQPLHQVAESLIEHLVSSYRVRASESRSYADTLAPRPPSFDRVVRLIPQGRSRTSMTVVFTTFPGLAIYIGTAVAQTFPACGCDACDDSVDHLVDELEDCMRELAGGTLKWDPRA